MTNLEAIREDLRPHDVRTSLIVRQCQKHGLTPTQDALDETKVAFCVIEILSQMISLNNVSESGVANSFDKETVSIYIKRKCGEVGLDSSKFIRETTVTYMEDLG